MYSEGVYHLYFQYNPFSPVAGNQHWGHATSPDLLHWTNRPIAIFPETAEEGIFSGSAVVDANNTSGFFNASQPAESRIVAIYTLNIGNSSQTQNVAYSTDSGMTFVKYARNPVIDLGSPQFRDPKVFWHGPTQKWVMAVVLAQEYQVVFYGSKNLIDWTECSRFGNAGFLGFQYEVPDLVEIPVEDSQEGATKWVLFVSINPGAPQGGSFTEYFIGSFDGTTFRADDASVGVANWGKDYYAGQTWSNVPVPKGAKRAPVVGLAWASNWQYTNTVPTSPWRSAQSLAREFTLKRWMPNPGTTRYTLVQKLTSLETLNPRFLYNGTLTSTVEKRDSVIVPLKGDGAFDFNVTVSSQNATVATNATLLIEFVSDDVYGYESLRIGYNDAKIYIDRGNAQKDYYNPFFTDKVSDYAEPLDLDKPGVVLRGVLDRSILELFVNNGQSCAVQEFFMSQGRKPGYMVVTVAEGMRADSISVAALESVWNCGSCP